MTQTAELTPVTITADTLQILTKQENRTNLVALYMMYVEITTWQKNNSVKATTEFMQNRLGWGEKRFRQTKQKLIELGLIEDRNKRDDKGRVTGSYILVKHVITPDNYPVTGQDGRLDYNPPSANDLHLSANDLNKSTRQDIHTYKNQVTEEDFRQITRTLKESEKVRFLEDRKRVLRERLKTFTLEEIIQAAKNLSKSPFHMGENEQGTKYACFDFLMRNNKQVDKWLNSDSKQERARLN